MARPGKTILIERGGSMSALNNQTRFAAHPSSTPLATSVNAGSTLFYLEPDDYIGTKLRLRCMVVTNATASVSDYTVGLYPITAVAGGAAAVTVTAGSVIAASLLTFTAPGASAMLQSTSPEFDWPTVGWYGIAIANSATGAANSTIQLTAILEAR